MELDKKSNARKFDTKEKTAPNAITNPMDFLHDFGNSLIHRNVFRARRF